jgi:signal transduction histidine kinase
MIVTQQNGLTVRVSVSDNALGISQDKQANLFELLNTTKKSGMGLGLWLCKHIITEYGGQIWYQDANGGGAEFIFELPALTS